MKYMSTAMNMTSASACFHAEAACGCASFANQTGNTMIVAVVDTAVAVSIFVMLILSGLYLVAVLMIMSLLVCNVLAGEQVKNNVFADSTETTSNFAARVS